MRARPYHCLALSTAVSSTVPGPLSGAVSPNDGIGEERQETPSLGAAEWHRFSRFSSLRELAIVAQYWEGEEEDSEAEEAGNGQEVLATNLAAALPGTNVCVVENDDMTNIDSASVCPPTPTHPRPPPPTAPHRKAAHAPSASAPSL